MLARALGDVRGMVSPVDPHEQDGVGDPRANTPSFYKGVSPVAYQASAAWAWGRQFDGRFQADLSGHLGYRIKPMTPALLVRSPGHVDGLEQQPEFSTFASARPIRIVVSAFDGSSQAWP